MRITLRPASIAIVVTAGLLLAAVAGGVGYAARSSGSSVSACASSKGRLALINSAGKCPRKYKKVTIAKQGPRGHTGRQGATGRQGVTGARGPGSVALRQSFTGTATGKPITLGGITYTASCFESDDEGYAAQLRLSAPTGRTLSLTGTVSFGAPGSSSIEAIDRRNVPSTGYAAVYDEPSLVAITGLATFGSTMHTVSARLVINKNPANGPLCSVEAAITPAG